MDKVRFDDELLRREAACDKFLPAKLGQCDIHIHGVTPGTEPAMYRRHGCGSRTRDAAAPIAPMRNAWPGKGASETLFADPAVAEKERVGTQEAEVMQGLDHANAFCASRIVSSRRD